VIQHTDSVEVFEPIILAKKIQQRLSNAIQLS